MPRLLAPLPRLAFLLIVMPGAALAHVEMLRPPVTIPVQQFGQLTPDPGIECIASDAALILGNGVYSVVTGARLATFPSPFDDPGTNFVLQDFDGNGVDDVLSFRTEVQVNTTMGMTRFDSGAMVRAFADIVFVAEPSLEFVGTMHLNSTETQALVLAGHGIFIVGQSGAMLYSSADDPAYPPGGRIPAVSIDDFDGDGYDEVAGVFSSGQVGENPELVLIGDAAASVGVPDSRIVARPMLLSARPNPVAGPALIAFELPGTSRVSLQIYDAAGRLVSRLADGPMVGGRHEVTWDGRDTMGHRVAGGVYFYELQVDGVKESRRIVRLR